MRSNDADILVMSDGAGRWDALSALRGVFFVADWPMDADIDRHHPDMTITQPVVIDVDLSEPKSYNRVRDKLRRHKGGRLALIRTHNRKAILRAHELGVNQYHVYPVDQV
ncbi:MAG: hypothetical protein R3245_01340, partial [Kiloniellales bacterium]|nr:hypothetical protein [Kiloniellales bacterium]